MSERGTRPSCWKKPSSPAPARSPNRTASPRQRWTVCSITSRASSRRIPPACASSSANASARSAVNATAPIAASPTRSSASIMKPPLSAAMRPRAATLPPPLALRLRPRELTVPLAAFDRRRELRNRHGLRSQRGLVLCEQRLHRGAVALQRSLTLLGRPLGLPLLEDRQQRSGDEDRRVRARSDSDEQREREVLEGRAAEDEQRSHRQQRDERRRQGAPDRLPERDVREDRKRGAPHQRDVLPEAAEDDDSVVDRGHQHGQPRPH